MTLLYREARLPDIPAWKLEDLRGISSCHFRSWWVLLQLVEGFFPVVEVIGLNRTFTGFSGLW
jgi:hypothetical protein